MVDVDKLSDAELQTKLQEYGFPVMPITGTTRKVMAKKLKMLIENRSKLGGETSGRRSLGRYSSEEESDTDIKNVKKKDNRRATMAAALMQPPSSTIRPKKATRVNESPEPEVKVRSPKTEIRTSSSTVTSRTKKIIQSAQDEFDTGSESESEIQTPNNYVTTRSSASPFERRASPVKPTTVSSSYSSRYSPPTAVESSYSSSRVGTYNASPSRPSSYSSSLASEYAADRLNQMRSRLSTGSAYESPSTYSSALDNKEETPFLSNFTKRLSTLSSPEAVNDRYYKNDVIKEHDTNGSSLYARTQLGSFRTNRGREPTYDKANQNSFMKNNFVSFAVLGGAGLFFILLAIVYLGMRSDTSVAAPAGSNIPHCLRNDVKFKRNVNCIMDEDLNNAINLLTVLKQELQKRAVANKCFDPTIKAHMTETEIINFCRTNFAIEIEEAIIQDLNNLEILIFHNPEWGLSIVQSETNNGQVTEKNRAASMEQVIFNRDKKFTSLVMFNPELPWRCAFYQTFQVSFRSLMEVTLIVALLYAVLWLFKYYRRHVQRERDEIGFMVERIIDILQSNAGEDGSENFLVINHVRDMILPVKGRKSKEQTWAKAVKFINDNESRIRTEVQEVQGEPFDVWRWIGSANLSVSGDHSVWKYRQGRRLVDLQYLINELLRFPHKRLRFCKNSDVTIKNEIREGLLSIILLHCGSCHREHSICTEDPNAEMMNVNQAFVAGIVSLGMSLYHLNELCSSLQIPVMSGKEYNVYLDELFEIYDLSLTDMEKSRDEKWKAFKNATSTTAEDSTPKVGVEENKSSVSAPETKSPVTKRKLSRKMTPGSVKSSTPKLITEENMADDFDRMILRSSTPKGPTDDEKIAMEKQKSLEGLKKN